jgi:hypothetical protein
MTRSRVLIGIISAVFCLTFVSSARADRSRSIDLQLEKLIFAERHDLTDVDIQSLLVGSNYEYTGHFENNNGKHLGFGNLTDIDIQSVLDTSYLFAATFENNGKHRGFSVAVVQQGPRLGIVKPFVSAATAPSQNPEPTAMVLLGTGLAAAAAFARKLNRKRRD